MLNQLCPCCGRHCYLDEPGCARGAEYAKTGVIPPRKHKHGERGGDAKKTPAHKRRYHTLDSKNKLIWNMRDIGHTLRTGFEGKGSQSRILIVLLENESMTQSELTEYLDVQPGSASEVIGKLESAGLIVRTQSERDRRTADIRLTDSGRIKAEEAAALRKQRHREMFSCLREDDEAALLMLLEKLNHDWRRRYRNNTEEKKRERQ